MTTKPALDAPTTTLADRYPRTAYKWLKSDDKFLLKAVTSGQSVLETAEDLLREHVSVLNRINELDVFHFEAGSEEWVEFMGLALAGVPMHVVIDWCTGSEDRMDRRDIEAMAIGDLRREFDFAREHGIAVPNSETVADLSWLLFQPQWRHDGYRAACDTIIDRFDSVTPTSLKNQTLGIAPPNAYLPRFATGFSAVKTAAAPAKAWARAYKKPKAKARSSSGASFLTGGRAAPRKTYRRKSRSPSYAF